LPFAPRIERRGIAAPQLNGEPDQIGGARELDCKEKHFGRVQYDCETGGREHEHQGECDEAAGARDERRHESMACRDVDRQQVVWPGSHIDCKARGQKQEPGSKGHDGRVLSVEVEFAVEG
jgi:hypothetical protein